MFINLDPSSPIPIFQQIHDRIVEGIAHGDLQHGDKLNPVRRVAAVFGINPATVQKAYDLLRSEGIIVTEKRTGSTVHLATSPTEAQRDQLRDDLARETTRACLQGFSADEIRSQLEDILADTSAVTARQS
ncbi:GntR family transcriptional regulator [Corynebacterium anserum]|uniref:GntR family transcriptional regulator n=1 Tax=Corynebacterium anserum TaxID=2684406 RepID=A0A7G7YQ57_9CORY|nr:GntR family transcriptional regulator [Corynebacterium anserum]QNH96627.1 GntR family transcriptional regulator [Corynebacterium anserum]